MSVPARERCQVAPERLRRTSDLSAFPFHTTADLPPFDGLIGQERAMKALQFGLDMAGVGYHIYVAGQTGTGKTSHSKVLVERKAAGRPPADDWCYVYNFDQPERPTALRFGPGNGPVFAREMAELILHVKTAVHRIFESKEYKQQRATLVAVVRQQIDGLVGAMEEVAASQGFTLQQTQSGLALMASNQPEAPVDKEQRRRADAHAAQLQEQLTLTMQQIWQVQKEAEVQIRELDRQVGSYAVTPIFATLQRKYQGAGKMEGWLARAHMDVLEHLDAFRAEEQPPAQQPALVPIPRPPANPLARYQVHVLVTHGGESTAPVVVETSPTFANLFGRLEHGGQVTDPAEAMGALSAGALHRASGGYLVLQAEDCIKNPIVWDTLKRTLLTREVVIQPVPDQPRLLGGPVLRPEPIPIDVKVVLIGPAPLHALLWSRDDTFPKLFKVKAEFDATLPWSSENLSDYLSFIGTRCRQDGLLHLDRGAVSALIEYASRLAEDQQKLSAQFNQVLEVLYEACSLAAAGGAPHVSAAHVHNAIQAKRDRSAQAEERFQEMISRGHLLIDVAGAKVGQVNGLSVYSLGDFAFGVPSRVTARAWMGRRGIVHIEKETQMSGHIHNKGVLTLSGFLGERFAQDKPLNLSASLSFEQLYGGVEGDSASSTELYALLSALSGAPVDQSIAVTGSVNQAGEIQPVGGVNQKIEGFYLTCKLKGLTGQQGVIIPVQNAENLMLDQEVVDAVRAGRFHVWAVSTIQEGVEILTGVPAGEQRPDGAYPPDSIFERVDKRLRSMAEGLRAFD